MHAAAHTPSILPALKPDEPISLPSYMDVWFGTLQTYCQAELTYPDKDKYAAIDGIGQLAAVRLGATY